MFQKVRVKKSQKKSDLSKMLETWSKLKIFIKNSDCEKSIRVAQVRFNKLDKIIENTCSAKNAKFSQSGMWKLKQKLHPQQIDPPMAKYDKSGNIINAPHLLRNLYLDTYVDRLRHREMQPEFSEVYSMKTTLWEYNYEMLKSKKSHNWEMTNLEMVLKNLKKKKIT